MLIIKVKTPIQNHHPRKKLIKMRFNCQQFLKIKADASVGLILFVCFSSSLRPRPARERSLLDAPECYAISTAGT